MMVFHRSIQKFILFLIILMNLTFSYAHAAGSGSGVGSEYIGKWRNESLSQVVEIWRTEKGLMVRVTQLPIFKSDKARTVETPAIIDKDGVLVGVIGEGAGRVEVSMFFLDKASGNLKEGGGRYEYKRDK